MRVYKPQDTEFYWVDFSVDGQRFRKSTKRTTRAEARAVGQAMLREELDRLQLGKRDEITVKEALERVLHTLKGRSSYGQRATLARKLLGTVKLDKPYWHIKPGLMMHEVDTALVLRLIEERRAEGCKENYIRAEVGLLGQVYRRCATTWKVRVDPTTKFEPPKYVPKTRFLTADEEQRLLAELLPDRPGRKVREGIKDARQDVYDLVVFLLDTGCRYSEATHTTWRDISLKDGIIDLYRSKTQNQSPLAMTARLREVLTRRYESRGDASPSPYIFPASDDPTKPRPHATAAITRAMNRANINDPLVVERRGKATVHSLRDTFASKLVSAGVGLYPVSKLLGHASMRMTTKYAHLDQTKVSREAAMVLDKLATAP